MGRRPDPGLPSGRQLRVRRGIDVGIASEEFPAGRIWKFFTGRDIPVEVVGAKGVHVLAKERADGSPVVLACNVRAKPTGPFRIRIMGRDEELGLGPWDFRTVE